jgi:DNA-binding beta-propeller fold protein YncE
VTNRALLAALGLTVAIAVVSRAGAVGRPQAAQHAHVSDQDSSMPLRLESKIPLGNVRGRLDHLAVDLGRRRLLVAELVNDTVGVIDIEQAKVIRTLKGLREPQGIGYLSSTDTVYVANGGDGTLRLFHGTTLAPDGQIALGDDADNVRVDTESQRVFVGYGSGALAIIDTAKRAKVADIPLEAHPESFQLAPSTSLIFVNVPEAGVIAVVDRARGRQVASWPTGGLHANFPLTLDVAGGRLLAVFRDPAELGVFVARDGHRIAMINTCEDSDDVFVDAKRKRVYVICGEGLIDVFAARGDDYSLLARIPTRAGARTGLFVPELDELFVAARATSSAPAAVWVYRPSR